jgi:hypothetical protein
VPSLRLSRLRDVGVGQATREGASQTRSCSASLAVARSQEAIRFVQQVSEPLRERGITWSIVDALPPQ